MLLQVLWLVGLVSLNRINTVSGCLEPRGIGNSVDDVYTREELAAVEASYGFGFFRFYFALFSSIYIT